MYGLSSIARNSTPKASLMSESMTRLMDADAVPEGEGRAARVEGIEPIAVFKIQGEFFVTQNTCSHARAALTRGWIEGFDICCPVHDGRFDARTGKALCFPATDPIKVFPSAIRDGAVWADLTTALKREANKT
jgi:nitrite reductase/ring-hydroxylating ferredoxin subunit